MVHMKCPNCESVITEVIHENDGKRKRRIIHRPWKDDDGSINWPNFLYVSPELLFVIGGIILLLFGFAHINEQCYDIVENPCKYLENYSCQQPTIPSLEYGTNTIGSENFALDSG